MDWAIITKWLVEHGAIGILAVGLGWALRVMLKRYDDLQRRYDEVQEKRLAERDVFVRALSENNRALSDAANALATRRR